MIIKKGDVVVVHDLRNANTQNCKYSFSISEKKVEDIRVYVQNKDIYLSEGDTVIIEDILAFSRSTNAVGRMHYINNAVKVKVSLYRAYRDKSALVDDEEVIDHSKEFTNNYEIGVN